MPTDFQAALTHLSGRERKSHNFAEAVELMGALEF
jgi:hypothetical protein